MFEPINNFFRPCVLCGDKVVSQDSFFCPKCSIFKDREKLQTAVDNIEKETTEVNEDWDTIIIDLNEDDDCEITFDIEE